MKKPLSEETTTEISEFLNRIIHWFCEYPQDAKINFLQGTNSSIIEIHPHPEDVGAMIGRDGSVAKGIRMLLTAYSRVIEHSLHPQIIEVGSREPRRKRRRKEQPE